MGEHPFISQGNASGEGVWIGRKRYRGNRILVAWLAVGEEGISKENLIFVVNQVIFQVLEGCLPSRHLVGPNRHQSAVDARAEEWSVRRVIKSFKMHQG